jgi:hypothetical protein
MGKPVNAELRVVAHKARQEIEIIYIADGSPVVSIAFNQEQAGQHARTMIEAIETLNASGRKPS